MKFTFITILIALVWLQGCAYYFADLACSSASNRDYRACLESHGAEVAHLGPVNVNESQPGLTGTKKDEFCDTGIKNGHFRDQSECDWARAHPVEFLCAFQSTTKEQVNRCIWRANNPIEAECEDQAKVHGGYWDCVRLKTEARDRQRSLQLQERQVRVNEKRLEAESEDRVIRQQAELWRAIGNTFKANQRRCVSKPYYGGIETICDAH